ncbi:hypothetical protein [Actinomadura sp. 7K534]|uniref:hypothetical protein n=1 Tax=Actinomadura sp. 7K534 TaxID=2530366 RepID=UPI001A9DACB5|nr:hypothetical protein [Actinomadura sp. 7K534]
MIPASATSTAIRTCSANGQLVGQMPSPGIRTASPAHMLREDNEVTNGFRRTLPATRREGVAGSWAAVRDYDLRRTAALIRNPTLVIAGEYDTVTSARHGEELAAAVPGAQFTVLPTVHLANVERPTEFLDAVITFLTERAPRRSDV